MYASFLRLHTIGGSHRRALYRLAAVACAFLCPATAGVWAQESAAARLEDAAASARISIPVSLDYPLLQQLLVTQLFSGPQESREILDDPSGCSEILLSTPRLNAADSRIELLAGVRARIGVGSPGACATMLSWQGRVGINGNPEIRSDGSEIGFVPEEIWLLDQAGQRVNNNALQSLAETGVRAAFNGFTVDLAPQLQSVGGFLPAVLPQHSRQQIQELLATLRISELQVATEAVNAQLTFAVEPLAEPLLPERALTEDELASWEERWQLMDALLVLTVKHYAAATQLQEVRDALLDALIESRYRLRDALVEEPSTGTDTVRSWFLQSWQSLTPTIRRIGFEQPGQEHLLLLSVIAATDALDALDQLGPTIGLDISTDGLRRLARMVIGSEDDELLRYSQDVDPQLRQLLEDSLKNVPPASAWHINLSPFAPAVAADTSRLNSWAPQRDDLAEYLPIVAALLSASAKKAAQSRGLDRSYGELFKHLVLTTAWQESCWRHYVISDDRKLVPLRSGTGDVGLMQINERVWRGFYDQQRLRWDIDYNSSAGAEVLVDYLVKYAIRKGEHRQPGGITNLARASYSAYNGGPSQVARYRSSKASSYGKKVDALFWEKYQQVAAGNELAVSACLGGNLTGTATGAPSRKSSGPSQAHTPGNALTLQLGAFSNEKSAQSFIRQHSLGSNARVRQRRKGASNQYLVIYGTYADRAAAEAAKQGLLGLEPWIRPLSDF